MKVYSPEEAYITDEVLKTVKLTTTDPGLPLLSLRYLGIPTTYYQNTHLSGAGEYTDKTLQDVKSTKVLACNGISAEVSRYTLMQRQVQAHPVSRKFVTLTSGPHSPFV
jgi:hypothetical protein